MMDVTLNKKVFHFIGIHAPNDSNELADIFGRLIPWWHIKLSNFNAVLDPNHESDRKGSHIPLYVKNLL